MCDTIQAIQPRDQPRLFATQNEWNTNLFKRVSDCIRDTNIESTDNVYQQRLKYWAIPQCNEILRILNNNWDNAINGVVVLNQQEYFWQRVSGILYGVRANTQMCGLAASVVNCAYVTP